MPHVAFHPLRRLMAFALACGALALPLYAAFADEVAGVSAAKPAAPALIPADNNPQFWFGVAVENIDPDLAENLKLKPDQGVKVVAVFANSPADKAGLRPKDLLVEINDKPLTSQEDLAKAANTANTVKTGASKSLSPLMQVSEISYLRKGDHFTTQITPEMRPADMRVSGANGQRITPAASGSARTPEVRNIVISNGNNVQYGPGYQVDANSQVNLKVLREAVGNGSFITITQETDKTTGTVKNTIRDGTNTYVVEAGKLDQIPANFRPLAQQILLQPQPAPSAAPLNDPKETTDDRLKRLELQNEDLKNQLKQNQAQLEAVLSILRANQNPIPNPAPAAK